MIDNPNPNNFYTEEMMAVRQDAIIPYKDMILKKDKEYYKQHSNINIQSEIRDVKIYKYSIRYSD